MPGALAVASGQIPGSRRDVRRLLTWSGVYLKRTFRRAMQADQSLRRDFSGDSELSQSLRLVNF